MEKQKIHSSAFARLYAKYKYRAKKSSIIFRLTKEQFLEITKQNCFYCGIQPLQIMKSQHGNGIYIYNGIDRVDSDGDYVYDNCVSCCWKCNAMKRDHTYEYFIAHIKQIIAYVEEREKNAGLCIR